MASKHHAAWCTCSRCRPPVPSDRGRGAGWVMLGLAIGAAISVLTWAHHAFSLSFFGL
jgi:hypothetical protein